ncbi:hypothetical protein FGIG_01559 [Fasciola gigantica]|uniref:Uncharacterized protein n=1 Tax=Fasciola gigantica TaxID=46835 RepID=A0A504YPS6_FASGI|nr:hypothetical protein FGIG_01559 [Fasciola gigantica]
MSRLPLTSPLTHIGRTSTTALPQVPGLPPSVPSHPTNEVGAVGQVITPASMRHADASSMDSIPPAWHTPLNFNEDEQPNHGGMTDAFSSDRSKRVVNVTEIFSGSALQHLPLPSTDFQLREPYAYESFQSGHPVTSSESRLCSTTISTQTGSSTTLRAAPEIWIPCFATDASSDRFITLGSMSTCTSESVFIPSCRATT